MKILTLISVAILLIPTYSYATKTKEALEQYELDSLRISHVGQYGNCGPIAHVFDPNGYVHQVRLGSYIGKQHGKIVKIEEDEIFVIEIHQDNNGEWFEAPVFLTKTGVKTK
jgi:type IV pilus assembly protein PilP